ncbi:MAG: hypothetical protein ACI8YD_003389, partial [Rheinheimera aquimaris]
TTTSLSLSTLFLSIVTLLSGFSKFYTATVAST